MTLTEIAERWCVDKFFNHGYIPKYAELLTPFRELPYVNVFEMGIGYRELMQPFVPQYIHGASLHMWEEFFPNGRIYAADIHPHTFINEGRISSMWCDQSKYESVASVASRLPELHVFCDDGSHRYDDQLLTAAVMLPKMAKNFVYLIEDVYPDTGAKLAETFGGRLYEFGKRPDDCVVVITGVA